MKNSQTSFAIFSDRKDPTKMGMFSKGGRFTSLVYPIFRKKNEILENKPKFRRVSNFPVFEVKFLLI